MTSNAPPRPSAEDRFQAKGFDEGGYTMPSAEDQEKADADAARWLEEHRRRRAMKKDSNNGQ